MEPRNGAHGAQPLGREWALGTHSLSYAVGTLEALLRKETLTRQLLS